MSRAEGITCPFCGAPIRSAQQGVVRCDYCSNEVRPGQRQEPIAPTASRPTPHSSPKDATTASGVSARIVAIIGGLTLVLGGVGAVFFSTLRSPTRSLAASNRHCFDSEPEGAEVVLAGKVLGRTSLCVPATLGKGQPRYEIRLKGYRPRQVELPLGKNRDVAVTLESLSGGDGRHDPRGVPIKVLWSKVRRADGCDFFSSPAQLGDVAYLEKTADRIAIEFDARMQRFEGSRTGEQLKLLRVDRYEHLSGTYRVTESLSVGANDQRLEGSYRYKECRLMEGERCPGRCRIEAEVSISFL